MAPDGTPGPGETPSPATSLEGRRAAFIARTTAAATHEFRNILAIVKESSGLVSDLVSLAGPERPDEERIAWALDRIQLQVGRGSGLATSLNRVMHGLDRDRERVVLAEAIGHAGLLAQRSARQRSRRIELEPGDEEVTVLANALDLYRALVGTMEWCVDNLPEDAALVVRSESRDGVPAATFTVAGSGTGFGDPAPDERDRLADAVVDIPATAQLRPDGTLLLVFGEPT